MFSQTVFFFLEISSLKNAEIENVFMGSTFLCAELKNGPSYCLICFCKNHLSWTSEYTFVPRFMLHVPKKKAVRACCEWHNDKSCNG